MESTIEIAEITTKEIEERQKAVGKKIHTLRKDKKYSLTDLSALIRERGINISPSQISRIENGEVSIDDGQRIVFSKIFGVSEDDLRGLPNSGNKPWFNVRQTVWSKHLLEIKEGIRTNDGSKSPHKFLIDKGVYIYAVLDAEIEGVDVNDRMEGISAISSQTFSLDLGRMQKYLVEISGTEIININGNEAIEGLASHYGEEIMFVFTGQLNFWFQQPVANSKIERRILNPGDCLHYSSKLLHGFSAVNGTAQALFVFSNVRTEMVPTTSLVEETIVKTNPEENEQTLN
jgi:transcriptional regulator with XRE-family HTH domain